MDPPTPGQAPTGSQMSRLPVNSPVINDDYFDDTHVLLEDNTVPASNDDNAPVTSDSAQENSPADNDVTNNVSDDQVVSEQKAGQERTAADATNFSSQPMEPATNIDSNRYPRRVHHPPQRYDDFIRH